MLVEGSVNSKRTDFLAEKYVELIKQGNSPDDILVILLNSYKKANFINKICALNPQLRQEKHQEYTFWGLCYNSINDNWEYISSLINKSESNSRPNLCGLEVSQFIFKQSIKEADFSDYISKVNLLHQLFRRYSLIVQNGLTTEEIKERSELLRESFYLDAQKAIDDYKLKTIKYTSFDYLRQLAILPFVYKNTDYFKKIKFLLVDDADEFSFAFWSFVYHLVPQLNAYYIAYDKNGSSRCGYLCAYKSGVLEFSKKYNPEIIHLKDDNILVKTAEDFFINIQQGKKIKIADKKYTIQPKRLDMFDAAICEINKLIRKGIKLSDISVITPVVDEVLMQYFKEQKWGIKFQVISGSEKLVQNNIVKYILILLKLINGFDVQDYELKSLLINLLKIPYRKCIEIIREYSSSSGLKDYTFSEDINNYRYKKLCSVIASELKSKNSISNQIKIIFSNIIQEFETEADKEKYDFLLKEAENFEKAFSETVSDIAKEFISQIENSVISENPIDSFALPKDAIIVSSPQKIIDFSIRTKYQLWLDVSNCEWLKQDTGTLYNAWVLSKDWNKKEYTLEDDILLTREKTARIVRKLMLCAQENIMFFSSVYDNTGNENFGGLSDFLEIKEEKKQEFKIIPRDDQKKVLEYKKGKMGVMAVPGAGKTTILLALIIKLLNEKVAPDNIFVLTYMESAAKNFKERIKAAVSDDSDLPNISTIHGLALRIIKENANYNKIGLDENFEICDDTLKERIIKELLYKLKIDDEKYDNYLRCISIVKLSAYNGELYSKYKDIQEFYRFYEEYNKILKQSNLLDYDDMLCYAVKILENNPEILNYYQNICKYIIEDEAQDSTEIQQKLISLLNGKYNNYVRCGDINQAITSTFTNSDLESFRNFIGINNKVEMASSQRCAKPIFSFANSFINEVSQNEETKNAFYNIQIKGTDKNPKNDKKPEYILFQEEKEEKTFIINKIKEIYNFDSSASIAVLLRLNSQVNEYNELLLSQGIKTSIRSDCLAQKNIYRLIHSVLNVINNPVSNISIYKLAQEYNKSNIYEFGEDTINFLRNLQTPFMKMNHDEINDEGLLQLFWDIDYWLNNSSIETDILVLNIGLFYSKNSVDKSNSYMISAMVKRMFSENESLENIIKKLEYSAQKSLSAYRFFENELVETNDIPIEIMTMHKSKGDEFDYVFIPELNEENYPTSIKNVKLKSGGHFVQIIKNSIDNKGIKTPDELKREQIEETLRLLYVGFTRAKKELYLMNSINYKKRKNTKSVEIINKILLET